MRIVTIFLATLLFFSSQVFAKELKLGDGLTLVEITKISDILADPKAYVGKRVLVEGLVTGVCQKRGCWMNIASDKQFQEIQIKVVDGVIVFPMSAAGKMAKIEGVVEELANPYHNPKAPKKEHKEGEYKGSGSKHTKNLYRIRGIGAIIYQ